MSKMDAITELLRAKIHGDDQRFWLVAEKLASHELAVGHTNSAAQLRTLVHNGRERAQRSSLIPLPTSGGRAPVTIEQPTVALGDMVLHDDAVAALTGVVREHESREKLEAHGFSPARKLLFHGPPGTGKSMAARALASALGLPIAIVQIDGVVDAHLGETSKRLRRVFDHAQQMRAVYLFDEADAIVRARYAGSDGASGELSRVTNSVLMMLDDDRSDSVFIAATNFHVLLDRAPLHRRFDAMVEFRLPDAAQCEVLVRRALQQALPKALFADLATTAVGLSHSDVLSAARAVGKRWILTETSAPQSDLVDAFLARKAAVG